MAINSITSSQNTPWLTLPVRQTAEVFLVPYTYPWLKGIAGVFLVPNIYPWLTDYLWDRRQEYS